MGESTRDGVDVDQSPLRFVAVVDGTTQEYPGPYDVTTPEGFRDFYWDCGFVVGWAAGHGFQPSDIRIEVYQGDKLIEIK